MGILHVESRFHVPAASVAARAWTAVTDKLQSLGRQAILGVERIEVGLQGAVVAEVHHRDGLRPTGCDRRSAPGTSTGWRRNAVNASKRARILRARGRTIGLDTRVGHDNIQWRMHLQPRQATRAGWRDDRAFNLCIVTLRKGAD